MPAPTARRRGHADDIQPRPAQEPQRRPGGREFRKAGYEPEGYTLHTYGTIQAWTQAVEKAGTTKTADVIKVLKSTRFDTVLGEIGFDAKGDVTAPGAPEGACLTAPEMLATLPGVVTGSS